VDGSAEPRARRVALVSLGCRVNRADTDALAAALGAGFAVAGEGEPADYVLVNTCTVTAGGDSASRRAIRRAAREHPGAPILATGCYAELRPEALRALPGVAAVLGVRAQARLPEVLAAMERSAPAGAAPAAGSPAPAGGAAAVLDRARAVVKVQDGCDARCSYCVVPLARGRSRSLAYDEAVARLAAAGARHAEVVLAGVHLGAYGRDLAPRRTLGELVGAAARSGRLRRLRLSSVEPQEFPLEVLGGEAAEALCRHFHLPLQSGAGRVLAAMRRPYRPRQVAALVERLAAAGPSCCLGADAMVGFPGETEVEHRESVRMLASLPLAYLHVFAWSPRPGAEAAALPDRVPAAAVRERRQELLELSARRWRGFLETLVGRELEAVVERVEAGVARGTTREYATVRWPAGRARRGDLVRVRVTGCDGEACAGAAAG